jgi:hypothetical protein
MLEHRPRREKGELAKVLRKAPRVGVVRVIKG